MSDRSIIDEFKNIIKNNIMRTNNFTEDQFNDLVFHAKNSKQASSELGNHSEYILRENALESIVGSYKPTDYDNEVDALASALRKIASEE